MSITIDLPPDVEADLLALGERYGSVEVALANLLRESLPKKADSREDVPRVPTSITAQTQKKSPSELTKEERLAKLKSLHEMAGSFGTNVDDDRASLYPVREP